MCVEYHRDCKGLEPQLNSRENQFNLVRLWLAILVTFDHAGLIVTGIPGTEPLKIFGLSAGYLAVNGFFIMSGILIAKSLQERGVSRGYFASRLLRLYPALIALALIAAFIIGPLVSKPAYWTGANVLSYAGEVLRFGDTSGAPLGFYPNNPLPSEFNSPLWTLRYEMACYLAAPFFVVMGLHTRWRWVAGLIALLAMAVAVLPPSSHAVFGQHLLSSILRFAFCFGLGMLVWSLRDYVRGQISWVGMTMVAFICAGLVGHGTDLMGTLFMGAVILWGGLRLPAQSTLKTDLSYGVYIWHFPVMQIITGEMGILPWWQLWALAIPISIAIAWASWTYIERPALRLKRYAETTSSPRPSPAH